MWSTAKFVWVPAIKIIFIRAVTLLSVLQVISFASDHTRLGFVSTSFQGSVHSVLQDFTCNSKKPRVLVFPGDEMWRNKPCGWHVEETDMGNLCTYSESLSRWALQHTLLLKPVFRQSPDISNRQNVGRGTPNDWPVDVILCLQGQSIFYRCKNKSEMAFEISTFRACCLQAVCL